MVSQEKHIQALRLFQYCNFKHGNGGKEIFLEIYGTCKIRSIGQQILKTHRGKTEGGKIIL